MKTIYFYRHAQSQANAGGVSQLNANIALSDMGHQQAQQLAVNHQYPQGPIFTSAFLRTAQTAQPLLDKWQQSSETLPLLNEFETFDLSLIEGLTGEQRTPLTQAYWQAANPNQRNGANAQTLNEFNQQVLAFVPTVLSLPNHSVVFGHGMWFALFMWHSLGLGQESMNSDNMRAFDKFRQAMPIGNASCHELICLPEKPWVYVRALP